MDRVRANVERAITEKDLYIIWRTFFVLVFAYVSSFIGDKDFGQYCSDYVSVTAVYLKRWTEL